MSFISIYTTHYIIRICLNLVDSNNQFVCNHFCIVAMCVTLSWSRVIIFKTVATIEKFADVTAGINLNNKLATRVIVNEFCTINNHLVKNNKSLTCLQTLIELIGIHFWSQFFYLEFIITFNKLSVIYFLNKNEEKPYKKI